MGLVARLPLHPGPSGPCLADAAASAASVCHTPAVLAGLAQLDRGGNFADGMIAAEGELLGGTELVSFDQQAIQLLNSKRKLHSHFQSS